MHHQQHTQRNHHSPPIVMSFVTAMLAFAICGCDRASAPPASGTPGARAASSSSESAGSAWFENATGESGVDFMHVSGHRDRFLMPEIMGGGGALFDLDNDGDLDLYLVQSGSLYEPGAPYAANQLYRNRGDGTFENITAQSGAGDTGYGMGCAAGDFDNDGFIDLYITNVGPNTLLRNNGDGTFTDVTDRAGVGHPGWGTSALFFDYNGDGHVDIFATNYLNWSISTELDCYNHMGGKDYCSPQNYNAPAMEVLYRNNGDGTFTDVTVEAGLNAAFGTGLGCIAADFDNNGWLDLFVANDGMKNQLWANAGNGRFVDVALRAGCAVDMDGMEKAGMGVHVADLDDDGDEDIIVCNLNQQSDSLYRNDSGYFSDVTAIAGLGAASRPFTRFGMAWHDFDHDGLLDLYQVNGRVMQQAELYHANGTRNLVRQSVEGASSPNVSVTARANVIDPYAEPNLLFRGVAMLKFEEVQPRGGTESLIASTGRAGIFGDIDNDGDIDIVTVNRDGPAHVLRNIAADHSGNHWITFMLKNEQGRVIHHAVVSVALGDRRIYRESRSGYSYLAANDPRINIGLGDADRATGVVVRWPDGSIETFGDFPADQIVTLTKGAGTPQRASPR